MPANQERPDRVYKYRAFSHHTLDMLVEDRMYFADPGTFNDPLDTKPRLEPDIDNSALERVLRILVVQRVEAELKAAAKTIRYKGPKTLEHSARQTQSAFKRRLEDLHYHATNPEITAADPLQLLLAAEVEAELLRRYDKGIVALGERADCPLMWSHYGDQHNGICIGYSIPADASLHRVRYDAEPLVKASLVEAMLDGKAGGQAQVDEAVLLRKAPAWRYENEWRLFGDRGAQDNPLELSEVMFGLRCPTPVQFTVFRALEKRQHSIDFYTIYRRSGTFDLVKTALNTDELCVSLPRRSRDVLDWFSNLTVEVPKS
ncbi:DUF2971 domain-containing protein [Lichenihabitans psoromatis]|uniref:DUF2971 domain-containing protein n=1 Tax=Lichenihabitans psoromatis TaxID=2528642 RepID=UPI00103858CA|nr:DUF2971 domain-containing protein [Lichenihabitans psoromatis]